MKRKTLYLISSIAIATQASAPAYAQDEGEEDQGARPTEIVVTAEFREAKLQDTPIAITAVNAEMLEARGQTDISQVAAQAPNVTLKPQPQNGGAGMIAFIRGVGQTDFNYAMDPGVGIYVDDVYIPTLSSSLLDLMDLDRIEILRGPQGTLAGKNSIGGAIKLFSQKPQGDGSGSMQVTYGSYNRLDLRGMADFKVTDNLFARVSGVAKSRDGYVDVLDYGATHPGSNVPSSNAHGAYGVVGTQGGQSYVAGRMALRWTPTDTVEVNIAGDYTSDHSEPVPTVLIAAGAISDTSESFDPWSQNPATNFSGGAWLKGVDGNPVPVDCSFVPSGAYSCDTLNASAYGVDTRYVSYANFQDSMDGTNQAPYKPYTAIQNQDFIGWGVQGNVAIELSDTMQLVWIGSYRKYVSRWGQDQDATPVPVAQLDNEMHHHAWSQEIRLNGELGDGLFDYTLGGFYMDQEGSYTARVDLNYAYIDFIHGPDTTPSTSRALFLNGALHPTDAWSISGGIRYSKDEKTYTYYRSNPDGTLPDACDWSGGAATAFGDSAGANCLLNGIYGLSDTFEGDRWDWRIVSDYRFSDALLAYASVATGYKGGGVNPRPFYEWQLKSFEPETITTYEIGFKSDLFDRRLRLNAAGFLNKYKDIILTLSACPTSPCLQPNNIGEAEVKGFEVETSFYPVDGLSIDGSLSYIDFKYKDTGTSGVPLTAVTPYTPEWTYSFGVQYDHELKSGAKLSARFDGSYQSDVFTEATNTEWSRVEGYFLGNARLSYTTADEDWRVSLEVQNLFDKYYFQSVSDVSASLGVVTGVPGLPRTWSVTVKRSF